MENLALENGEISQIARSTEKWNKLDTQFEEKLIREGVYIASGDSFFAERNGWYQITFSMPFNFLEIGLKRVDGVLKAWKGVSTA